MDPTDIDVEEARAFAILRRAHSVKVGRIVTYDATTNRARVELGLVGMTALGIADTPFQLPSSIPVIHLRGRGSGVYVLPDTGDEVVLLIADRALDRWLIAGGPVPLESDRMHDLVDAIAIAGVSPSSKPLPAAAAVSTLIGRDDGTATLALTRAPGPPIATLEGASGVRLGQGATHPVVLGDNLLAALTAFAADLAASVLIADVIAAGAALATALGAAPMLSTKVQTE